MYTMVDNLLITTLWFNSVGIFRFRR